MEIANYNIHQKGYYPNKNATRRDPAILRDDITPMPVNKKIPTSEEIGIIKVGDDILSQVLPQYHLRWQA